MPGVFLLGSAVVTGEDIPDLWPRIIRGIVQASWFAVPAIFLARGSRVARWFAIFFSLISLGVSLVFATMLIGYGGDEWEYVVAAPLVLVFLFSTWALLFYRGLREALAQRLERWNAAERARMQELEDAVGEASEK
jgi:hypothetical protein